MDPKEVLRVLRDRSRMALKVWEALDRDNPSLVQLEVLANDARVLAEHFQALDDWMQGKGSSPWV